MWGIDGRHCPRLTILLHFGSGRSAVDIIPDAVLPSSASSTLTKQSNSEDHPLSMPGRPFQDVSVIISD